MISTKSIVKVLVFFLATLGQSVSSADDLFIGGDGKKAAPNAHAETASTAAQARGILQAGAEATLSSQIAGRVVELPFKVGDSFNKGDVLARLDCDFYQAQLVAAQAAAAAENAQMESNRQLAKLHSIGVLEVQLAEAKWRKAEAEVQLNRTFTDHCKVVAPFAGRVVETRIHNYESVSPGTEFLAIVDRASPEIRLIVSSRWLAWLQPGSAFSFQVDETGASFPATVTAIGARIDAVSQTVPVRAQFSGKPTGLVAGMSGTANFTAAAPARKP